MEFDVVNRCLNSETSTEPLTVAEEKEMILRYKKGDQEARHRLIESNMRFVVKMALSYRNQGVALSDLIQEGNVGLIEALDKFNVSKNCRLITYASWWIRLYIQRTVEQKCWPVNIPVNKMEILRKIRGFETAFLLQHGNKPTLEDISRQFDLPCDKIQDILENTPSFHSIHSQDDENPGLEKILVDESHQDARDELWFKEAESRLNSALKILTPKEREVLSYRFYSNERGKKLSLRKVGQRLGLSAEGVRRIEAQAMSKLRRPHILAKMESLFAA